MHFHVTRRVHLRVRVPLYRGDNQRFLSPTDRAFILRKGINTNWIHKISNHMFVICIIIRWSSLFMKPSRLGLSDILTGSLHLLRVKTLLPNECPDMTLNFIWWWGSNPEVLGNVEYIFIAITLFSSLTRSGSTC